MGNAIKRACKTQLYLIIVVVVFSRIRQLCAELAGQPRTNKASQSYPLFLVGFASFLS